MLFTTDCPRRPGAHRAVVLPADHGPCEPAHRRSAVLHTSRRVARSSDRRGGVLLVLGFAGTGPDRRRSGVLLNRTGGTRGRGTARPAGRPSPAVRRERLRRQREGLRCEATVTPTEMATLIGPPPKT